VTTKDEDAELHHILEMNEERLRAHIAAQGLDCARAAAEPWAFQEDASVELEKTLFGASLDDIMTLSEFTDLDKRFVGFVRQNQGTNSTPGAARSHRDHTTPVQHDNSTLD
jgi:hypothetical protein